MNVSLLSKKISIMYYIHFIVVSRRRKRAMLPNNNDNNDKREATVSYILSYLTVIKL